jgi:hypothetical protein
VPPKKKPAVKAAGGKKRREFVPTIAWDRFDAMTWAVYRQLYEAQPIDNEMLSELYDAMVRLRTIYQEDLDKSLPNRRIKQADLMDAAVARFLIEQHGVTLPQAMQAATGKAQPVESDSVARTFKNRSKVLGTSGIYGLKDLRVFGVRVLWARRRLRRYGAI